ncbi:hypothetical protein V2J09_010472 [Rumex salicifolius]
MIRSWWILKRSHWRKRPLMASNLNLVSSSLSSVVLMNNCNGASKTDNSKKLFTLFFIIISTFLPSSSLRFSGLKQIVDAHGFSGGIWIFWDDNFEKVDVVSVHENFVRVTVSKLNKCFQIVFVCAPPSNDLSRKLLLIQGNFFMGGDLNCIFDASERQGGSGELHQDSTFTWSRGTSAATYIAKRLDRVMFNIGAQLQWPSVMVCHLPKSCSDHTPLLLIMNPRPSCNWRRRPFRFEAAWLSHQEFKNFLASTWMDATHASPALTRLCPKLIVWNRDFFGNIEVRKSKLLELLDEMIYWLLMKLSATNLSQSLIRKRSYGRDRNTAFFRASTFIRHRKYKVEALKNEDDRWVHDRRELEHLAASFFRDLYHLPLEEHTPLPLPHGRFPTLEPSVLVESL